MKRLFFLIVSIASILNLTSCAGDEDISLDPEKFVVSTWMSTFDDTFILDKANAEEILDTLRWTPTDFGCNAVVSYEVQIALKKEDVNEENLDFVTLGITNQNKYGVRVKDINATLLSAGAVKRRPSDFVMRIKASISSSYKSLLSSNTGFVATTFSTDPDLLYVIGDYNNFNIDNAEVLYSPEWNGTYEGFVYLPKLEQGIKLVEEIAPETEWGLPTNSTPATTINIVANGKIIAPGSFVPGSNKEEILDGPGFYRMVVKITETTKTFTLYKFYKEFFIAGQRNMNYPTWANSMSNQNPENETGTGAVLTYNVEGKVWEAKNMYLPEFQTDANGTQQTSKFEFKFRANAVNNIWANAANLGSINNAVKDGIQTGEISGTTNIKSLVPEGYYDIKVYLQCYPRRYELIPGAK
jgi:hypothetical protein